MLVVTVIILFVLVYYGKVLAVEVRGPKSYVTELNYICLVVGAVKTRVLNARFMK